MGYSLVYHLQDRFSLLHLLVEHLVRHVYYLNKVLVLNMAHCTHSSQGLYFDADKSNYYKVKIFYLLEKVSLAQHLVYAVSLALAPVDDVAEAEGFLIAFFPSIFIVVFE